MDRIDPTIQNLLAEFKAKDFCSIIDKLMNSERNLTDNEILILLFGLIKLNKYVEALNAFKNQMHKRKVPSNFCVNHKSKDMMEQMHHFYSFQHLSKISRRFFQFKRHVSHATNLFSDQIDDFEGQLIFERYDDIDMTGLYGHKKIFVIVEKIFKLQSQDKKRHLQSSKWETSITCLEQSLMWEFGMYKPSTSYLLYLVKHKIDPEIIKSQIDGSNRDFCYYLVCKELFLLGETSFVQNLLLKDFKGSEQQLDRRESSNILTEICEALLIHLDDWDVYEYALSNKIEIKNKNTLNFRYYDFLWAVKHEITNNSEKNVNNIVKASDTAEDNLNVSPKEDTSDTAEENIEDTRHHTSYIRNKYHVLIEKVYDIDKLEFIHGEYSKVSKKSSKEMSEDHTAHRPNIQNHDLIQLKPRDTYVAGTAQTTVQHNCSKKKCTNSQISTKTESPFDDPKYRSEFIEKLLIYHDNGDIRSVLSCFYQECNDITFKFVLASLIGTKKPRNIFFALHLINKQLDCCQKMVSDKHNQLSNYHEYELIKLFIYRYFLYVPGISEQISKLQIIGIQKANLKYLLTDIEGIFSTTAKRKSITKRCNILFHHIQSINFSFSVILNRGKLDIAHSLMHLKRKLFKTCSTELICCTNETEAGFGYKDVNEWSTGNRAEMESMYYSPKNISPVRSLPETLTNFSSFENEMFLSLLGKSCRWFFSRNIKETCYIFKYMKTPQKSKMDHDGDTSKRTSTESFTIDLSGPRTIPFEKMKKDELQSILENDFQDLTSDKSMHEQLLTISSYQESTLIINN